MGGRLLFAVIAFVFKDQIVDIGRIGQLRPDVNAHGMSPPFGNIAQVRCFALPRQEPRTGTVPVLFFLYSIPQKKVESKWFFCELYINFLQTPDLQKRKKQQISALGRPLCRLVSDKAPASADAAPLLTCT